MPVQSASDGSLFVSYPVRLRRLLEKFRGRLLRTKHLVREAYSGGRCGLSPLLIVTASTIPSPSSTATTGGDAAVRGIDRPVICCFSASDRCAAAARLTAVNTDSRAAKSALSSQMFSFYWAQGLGLLR